MSNNVEQPSGGDLGTAAALGKGTTNNGPDPSMPLQENRSNDTTTQRSQDDNPTASRTQQSPTPPKRSSSARATPLVSNGPDADQSQSPPKKDAGLAPGAEKPKKKRSLLAVPSRSSSHANQEPSPTATALTGATVSDPADSISRGSKGSISDKRRNGSIASSLGFRRGKKAGGEGSGQASHGADLQDKTILEEPQKGGFFSFLSVLNCCGVPQHGHPVEGADDEPARKTTKLRSVRGRQPTPVGKEEKTAGEQGQPPAKEPLDEKLGGVPPSDTTQSTVEGQPAGIAQGDASTDKAKTVDSTREPVDGGEEYAPNQTKSVNAPLPPLPDNALHSNSTTIATQGLPPPADVKVTVEAPTPVPPQEEQPISDRTPRQAKRDTDIEMTEASPVAATTEVPVPPQAPEASEMVDQPRGADVAGSAKTALPPPPALANREAQAGNVTDVNNEVAVADVDESHQWLLPPIRPEFKGKKCLVLDLDETLVHSSFKILHQADFTIPVEIEGQYHNVYVIKRPGVDQFMRRIGELYEVVVFTASVSKYGDPLLDQLDIHNVVHHRLFRESCYNHQGNYVKDLSQVGRDLRETIIIDNSPTSYIFHPQHAVPISSWFSDAHDNELLDLIPVLEDLAGSQVRDVSLVLDVAL
ncbi:MAG: hypothetical protein M1819_000697 [Sarea resinae]|nr:MAG: hypothetical protein M1819_000697 [Sarea resinae]